jgi:hypothetical protein
VTKLGDLFPPFAPKVLLSRKICSAVGGPPRLKWNAAVKMETWLSNRFVVIKERKRVAASRPQANEDRHLQESKRGRRNRQKLNVICQSGSARPCTGDGLQYTAVGFNPLGLKSAAVELLELECHGTGAIKLKSKRAANHLAEGDDGVQAASFAYRTRMR